MKHNRKLAELVAAMALASVVTTSAFAQMGGGGMMGGFGAGGGTGMGMMGGNGMGSRNDNGYGPGTNGVRRDSPLAPDAPDANRLEPSGDIDPGPLYQLDLSRRQLGEIRIIRAELSDRQSNARRRLKAEQAKLSELYDAPERDQAKIDKRFHRIERLRREMFESSINARDRIAAQLSSQQQQRLHRIAPRWYAGG